MRKRSGHATPASETSLNGAVDGVPFRIAGEEASGGVVVDLCGETGLALARRRALYREWRMASGAVPASPPRLRRRPGVADPVSRSSEALRRRVEEQGREIRRLSYELALARQRERDQIAQILHDEFQQLLYALRIRLDAVAGGASMDVHGGAIHDLVEQANALIHTLVVSLTPPIHESDDLAASLDWLADYICDRYGVEVEVACKKPLPTYDQECRVLLFEAARELLFNVVKHAGVERAALSVEEAAGEVCVVVEDQGRGLDLASAGKQSEAGGYGLHQLRRRLRLLGGRLDLESAPGEGVRASAAIPI